MEEPTYWNRFWRRRLSRRRLLSSAALTGGGLAAAAVVGCGGDESGTETSTGGGAVAGLGDDLEGEVPEFIDARREAIPAPEGSRGGTLRYQGFDPVVLDRHDPHQTQFGPMYANLSSVFSKLYMYTSHYEPTWENIVPDLAESAPEMVEAPPETLTYVVKLRKGVKFHNTDAIRGRFPNLAGRELKADDVVFSYERQKDADKSIQKGYYYRASQYRTIDSIKAVDDYTIEIKTKTPVAPFYHFMADTNAMIIPKDIVDNDPGPGGLPLDTVDTNRGPAPGERMIGTGPFLWGDLKFGIEYKAIRNPEWFGWDEPDLGRPYLDGYTVSGSSLNDTSLEALFRRREVDTAGFIENPDWVFDIKREKPELEFFRSWISGWINSRFKTFCAPYDDVRVRKAIHLATERQQIVDVIGSGEWKMQGAVGNAIQYWALPYEELLTLEGYRQSTAERTEDITKARQLFEAAGSPELPQVWFADIPSYIPNFIGTWKKFMSENLGIPIDNLKTLTQAYSRIAEAIADESCDIGAMTWGFDNGWIDLDDWVYPYFHSTGSKNSFRLNDPELDILLDKQRAEFDIETRRELGYTIQRYLLGLEGDGMQKGAHARSDYATPRTATVAWPYFKNRVAFPWFGNSHWVSNVWLDKDDPSYRGRPN
ncbi:MAG TPA: ABC transporter substrate-binding protein [Dehalococcoidia bacterium]|nr:ABC transporter substrate-binding protein [Dehalococcoidia bacterium]